MTAEIIRLEKYRKGVRFKKLGVAFPQLYRAQGYYFNTDLSVSDQPASPAYTLSEDSTFGLADVVLTPIRGFTPGVDSGWLIVRRHRSMDALDGYLDAQGDLASGEEEISRSVFVTKEGIFTLFHRPPTRGCPDHLVVYMTKCPGPVGEMNACQIFHPDGSITYDEDLLSSPED